MTLDEIRELLINAAESRARDKGYRFGPGADSDIKNFADKGAQEVIATSNREQKPIGDLVGTARHAFETLVDQMITAKTTLPELRDQDPGIIGERTLGEALSDLCPIWPICKEPRPRPRP